MIVPGKHVMLYKGNHINFEFNCNIETKMRYLLVSADNPNIQKPIDIPDEIIVSKTQKDDTNKVTPDNTITPKKYSSKSIAPKNNIPKNSKAKKVAYKIIQTRTFQRSRPVGGRKSKSFRKYDSDTI